MSQSDILNDQEVLLGSRLRFNREAGVIPKPLKSTQIMAKFKSFRFHENILH